MESCDDCNGTGCDGKKDYAICSSCQGSGQILQRQSFFTIKTTCPHCNGAGKTIKNPCFKCSGKGRIHNSKKISVKIPVGVDSGSKLRLINEGEGGIRGGDSGDLYVVLSVGEHKLFKRNGLDVVCVVDISFIQAILGDKIFIPSLQGKETFKIPNGTQYGDVFTLKKKGIQAINGTRYGDQIIQVRIKMPKKITKKQESALKNYAKLDSKKFVNKLKNWFK